MGSAPADGDGASGFISGKGSNRESGREARIPSRPQSALGNSAGQTRLPERGVLAVTIRGESARRRLGGRFSREVITREDNQTSVCHATAGRRASPCLQRGGAHEPDRIGTAVGRSTASGDQHRGIDHHRRSSIRRERRVVHVAGQRRRWPATHHLPGPDQPRPEVCHVRKRLRLGEQLDQGLHRSDRERGPAQLARGRLQRPAARRLPRRDQPGSQIRDLRADRELRPGRELDQGSSRCPG